MFVVYLLIKSIVVRRFMGHTLLLLIQLDQVFCFQDLLPEVPVIQFAIKNDLV